MIPSLYVPIPQPQPRTMEIVAQVPVTERESAEYVQPIARKTGGDGTPWWSGLAEGGWPMALGAMAGIWQASSEDAVGLATQAISRYNARRAEARAVDALARGAEEEQRLRRQGAALVGQQRAGYAGQGVVVDSGSAAAVQEQTGRIIDQDAATIRLNAAREAWGYRMDAANLRIQGDHARRAGRDRAIGTLLTTGAGMAQAMYGGKK